MLLVLLLLLLFFLLRLGFNPTLRLKLDGGPIIFNVFPITPPPPILPRPFIPTLILECQLAPAMEKSLLKSPNISMLGRTVCIARQKPRPTIRPIRRPRVSKLAITGSEAILPPAMISKSLLFRMPFAVSLRLTIVQTADINGVHVPLRARGVLADHAISSLLAPFELVLRCRIILDFLTLVAGNPVWDGRGDRPSCGGCYRRRCYGGHDESRPAVEVAGVEWDDVESTASSAQDLRWPPWTWVRKIKFRIRQDPTDSYVIGARAA